MVYHTAGQDDIEAAARNLQTFERHQIDALQPHVVKTALRHPPLSILETRAAQIDPGEVHVGLQRRRRHQTDASTAARIEHIQGTRILPTPLHPAEQQACVHTLAKRRGPRRVGIALVHRTHPFRDLIHGVCFGSRGVRSGGAIGAGCRRGERPPIAAPMLKPR